MPRPNTCKTCEHGKATTVLEGLPHNPGECTKDPEWKPIKDMTLHYCNGHAPVQESEDGRH